MIEYLVVSEVSQKQNYIFKSNKLKENIGASINIRTITEQLPDKLGYELEKILSGGGKNIYGFAELETAKKFIFEYSCKVLEEYHGVEIFMAMQDYNKEQDSIIAAIQKLYQKLEAKKSARSGSYKLTGLGISQICSSSLLPVNQIWKEKSEALPVSYEIFEKLKAAGQGDANTDFPELMPQAFQEYSFPREFSELGGVKDEKRYIAIVVLDGNQMGKKISIFQDEYSQLLETPSAKLNEQYKEDYYKFSQQIDALFKKALKETINILGESIPSLNEMQEFHIEENKMPFRPLIQAGDDVCYVIDARIAIDFTCKLLSYIHNHPMKYWVNGEEREMSLSVSAGIAMVKEGYPFFKAHKLAENLCDNAKTALSIINKNSCALDFHIAQGEISDDIAKIREENYTLKLRDEDLKLTNKPYIVDAVSSNQLSKLFRLIHKLKSDEIGRRNVMDLKAALRGGSHKTEDFLKNRQLTSVIKIDDCYQSNKCICFDAIEVMDYFLKIGRGTEDSYE